MEKNTHSAFNGLKGNNMNLPWYQHKKFEMRIIVIQKPNSHPMFGLEHRLPSRIPFIKFSKWKHFEGSSVYETLDGALDELNKYKNYFLNKGKEIKNPPSKLKIKWEKINLD